jgi:hypothetical protein
MGTLTSGPVKDVYQKLAWYDTSTNKLMYTNASDVDTDIGDVVIGGDLTVTGNDIKSSSATAFTLSGANVAVAGTVTIGSIAEVGSDTDKFLIADSGTVKYVTGANVRSYIGAGTSSVANLNDLGDVSYSSGDLTITSLDKIVAGGSLGLETGDNGSITIDANCTRVNNNTNTGLMIDYDHTAASALGQTIYNEGIEVDLHSNAPTHIGSVVNKAYSAVVTGGTSGIQTGYAFFGTVDGHDINNGIYLNVKDGGTDIKLVSSSDVGDYFTISTTTHGATTITTVDDDAAAGHLNIEPDGHVEFDGCGVGFNLQTPTYNASDTDVDFRSSNKQFVTFGSGNIADLNLKFPATSGNFTLLLKQDGTGSRTIDSDGWLVFDAAGNAANGSSTVKFSGGTNPTLTTDANHVDIISFFWDADNEIAYGAATLDFQF